MGRLILLYTYWVVIYFDYRNILDRFNVLWIASDGNIGRELGDPTAWDQGRGFYLGVKIEFGR